MAPATVRNRIVEVVVVLDETGSLAISTQVELAQYSNTGILIVESGCAGSNGRIGEGHKSRLSLHLHLGLTLGQQVVQPIVGKDDLVQQTGAKGVGVGQRDTAE